MAEIINPNNPVYFTYARNSEEKAEWRHIADVVPDLLDAFRSECVKYSVDVEDIKNGAKISSYEKEIGDANYVIVVLSDRYFYRYHCMFELSNVLKNAQGKKIKYIKVGNFNLNSNEYRKEIKKYWNDQKFEIEDKINHNYKISELEQAAKDNNYYFDFIDNLSSLFRSVNYTNAESLRKKLLGQNSNQVKFVTDIKKDFGWTPKPPEPPKSGFNEKYILYSLIAVLFFWVLGLSVRKPDTGTDNITTVIDSITKVTDTIPPKGDTMANNVPSVVDLGLSVLWADRNIGADSPTDYGDCFAWGEIKTKKTYDWDSYNGDYNKLTKYCTQNNYGKVDNKKILDPEDDAATQNWGNNWRMPTVEEYTELFAVCECMLTKKDGVNGCEFISKKNGNKIFFPIRESFSDGFYWSSSLNTNDPNLALCFHFNSDEAYPNFGIFRYIGFPVRAVRSKN
jgi:hypothetical protein